MQPIVKEQSISQDTRPLSYPLFRALWVATLIANICLWMQNVASAWLMVELNSSPLMVALVQTAITLPAFLFGLPAGVYADLIDRRHLLICTHTVMLAATILLFFLVLNKQLTPWLLLVLTFVLGTGSAISIPAWVASTSDTVPRSILSTAINLNAIAYNGARAVGPALAGFVIASAGMQWVYALNCLLLIGVLLLFIFSYKPTALISAHPEPLLAAMRAGIRYVRHAHQLHGHMLRVIIFISCASSLWSLLPLVAGEHQVGGFGILLGSLGAGAVSGGLLLNYMRSHIKNWHLLTNISMLLFLSGVLAAAWIPWIYAISAALFFSGMGWIGFNSTTSAAFQTSLPAWVRARAVAVFMLTFQGSMAIGGAFWGVVANYLDISWTLTIAAGLLVIGIFFSRHYPLRMADEAEVTLSGHWAEPQVPIQPAHRDGPVAIQIDYQVFPESHTSFSHAAHLLGHIRRRDGASHWMLYQDIQQNDHFSERFIVSSWGEYIQQNHRATMADMEYEKSLNRFLKDGYEISISYHLLVTPFTSLNR